ncbi:alpha/beta hydrolase family protein [Massilia niastensis]|uniref:alpha/beta hydrolase family protein n=1 Tax=Massilia niastensis TaxID=544911 RepID=UPI00035F6796|nr:S9 family peptidase [Massilia niastensis]
MPRLVICALLCALLMPSVRSEPLTIDEAIDPSGMLSASLSPDGKHVAAILYNGTNHGLVLIDAETLETKKLVEGRYATTSRWRYHKSPRGVSWAANDVLLVDYGLEAEALSLTGKRLMGVGERVMKAVDPVKDPGKVLVSRDVDGGDLSLCDIRAVKCKSFSTPSGKPIKWALDRKGNLRAVTLMNSAFFKDVTTITNWYRPSERGEWTKLAEFKITDDYWVPVYVPDEPDTLVINSRFGRDTYALFNYDVKQLKQTDMLAGHPAQDIVSWDGIDREAFDYVVTSGMLPQQVWFDAAWRRMQLQVDALLPKRFNVLSGDPKTVVLIESAGDVDPGSWYLFDIAKKRLVILGRKQAELDREKLRPMEVIAYPTPDGLTIPAYLTRPERPAGPAPLVVLIHGGPIARDAWYFDADVQIIASQGYLVLQPQFRGSAGFGRKFEEAGYRQWGRAMQDDITAGVEHLVKQGIADPDRVCIVGASYGGYAALWGLVKTPHLYKCGVSFAGVTDVAHMYTDWSDRSFNKVSRQMMMHRIGDKNLGAEFFDPVSPLKHAAKIQSPVLLMHGEEDERVPISHGKKMREALEQYGKTVTWLAFEEEGHGLVYVKNQYKYYVTLLDFLSKHIGPKPPVAPVHSVSGQ